MATNILPHKALNSIDSMNYCLKDKLNTAKQTTDLIPFINVLTNVDNLKNILKKSLDEQYEKQKQINENNSSSNKIRSLFLSLYSLNGIPSDIIHANIISFLPSTEYKKLPLISKMFRNIMKNNPFIYNEKGYEVELEINTEYLDKMPMTKMNITHPTCKIKLEATNDGSKKLDKYNHSYQ